MSTTRTRTSPRAGEAWVEIVSGGDRNSTHVHLVIRDGAGAEIRYAIPNVLAASWEISPGVGPVLRVDIAGARGRMTTHIEAGKTSVEDLLAEIAASRLSDDGSGRSDFAQRERYGRASHAAHCAKVVASDEVAAVTGCDCEVTPE